MTVKQAREQIEWIGDVSDEASAFNQKHIDLSDETMFLPDVVSLLSNYKEVLEGAIDNAEIKIG